MGREIANDDEYNAGIPDMSQERIDQMYLEIRLELAVERGDNDADKRTVKSATYHSLKAAARACGCPTCSGVLENIKDAVTYYKQVERVRKTLTRINRRYFIQKLRDALASRTISHNFTQGV